MAQSVIKSLDELLRVDAQTRRQARQVPGLGFAIGPGLTVVAGASSMGSTSMTLKIAAELAASSDAVRVLIICVASGPRVVARRLESYSSVLDRSKDARAQIWIDDGLALCPEKIADRARRWAQALPTASKLIVIDDLQHLAAVEQKTVAGARSAASLRQLSVELETPILLSARLPIRRRRSSWYPTRSELLAYGPILEHCDATILIYRNAYYEPNNGTSSEAELQLWPGEKVVEMHFDATSGTFEAPL